MRTEEHIRALYETCNIFKVKAILTWEIVRMNRNHEILEISCLNKALLEKNYEAK